MCCDLFVVSLLSLRLVLIPAALKGQIDECIQVFEVLRCEQPMVQLLMFAHLVPVAQTPALHAQILRVSTRKVGL